MNLTHAAKITSVTLLLFAVTSGCSHSKKRVESDAQKPAQAFISAKEGKALYAKHCQTCHGTDGRGQGPAADRMTPKPRDFTTGQYRITTTNYGMPPTDGDLHQTISEGVPGTAMPGWRGTLSEAGRWSIVEYLKTFSDRFDSDVESAAIEVPKKPERTPDSVSRGRRLFGELPCAGCHGKSGRGDGPQATDLVDGQGNKLVPRDFVKDTFKRGDSPSEIYLTIATGIEGTPMPGYGPMLEDKQIWDLVYYIRSRRDPGGVIDYLFGDNIGETWWGN